MSLSREQILEADDLPREPVKVPEWGGTIFVRTMTGLERDEFESAIIADKGKTDMKNFRARLAALTITDEDGNRLFKSTDMAALGRKSASALDRVFAVAQKLNGMSAADMEEAEKNSDGEQTVASISGSA